MINGIKAYTFKQLKVGMEVYDDNKDVVYEITDIVDKRILHEQYGPDGDFEDFEKDRFYPIEAQPKLDVVPMDGSQPFDANEVSILRRDYLQTMQSLADLCTQKKQIEAQEKEVKEQLAQVMDEYGIKSFDNDIVKVVYIEATTKTTVDSKTLKSELPDVYAKYSKTSDVKGYAKVTVK